MCEILIVREKSAIKLFLKKIMMIYNFKDHLSIWSSTVILGINLINNI